jgi:hypothetical protein
VLDPDVALAADGPAHFTPEGNRALRDIRHRLHDLRDMQLSPAELDAELTALLDQLRSVLRDELVPAGDSRDGAGEGPDATEPSGEDEETVPGEAPSDDTETMPEEPWPEEGESDPDEPAPEDTHPAPDGTEPQPEDDTSTGGPDESSTPPQEEPTETTPKRRPVSAGSGGAR